MELRPELNHFPGVGAEVETLNLGPDPECLPGAGAGAVQNYPGSASLFLAIPCHPCGLESSWPLGALPAARRPPGQSVLSGAAHTVSQARGTHKDDRGSLNRSQAVACRAYEHSGYARSLGFATPMQSPNKKLSLCEVPQKSGGRRTARIALNIQEGTEQLGMRQTTVSEMAPRERTTRRYAE